MTKQIMNFITEPDIATGAIDLLTLEEMKLLLNIAATDTSKDATLQLVNTQMSAAVAKLVGRVFGFSEVNEMFFEIEAGTPFLFFSQWPVKLADISFLTMNGVDILPEVGLRPNGVGYYLEEKTGTLYGGFSGTVDSTYSGGYHLPDEAPPDLKAATAAVSRESYYNSQRGMLLTGVRMIAHKSARVMYHSPTQGSVTSTSAVSPQTWNAVRSTLDHYFRPWI
jgi:hypothetical protein